jgi:hypothetical protein
MAAPALHGVASMAASQDGAPVRRAWWRRRLAHIPRWARLGAGAVAAALVLLALLAFAIDEPLRRSMEAEINARLDGYEVRIGRLDFHPLGFSLDLERVSLVQEAHPDPPVASLPRLSASVQWKALLFGRLVANFALDDPVLHVNREHLRREAEDAVPVEARGWQEAVQAIYPLKVNHLAIRNARVTYVERPDRPPLELHEVHLTAENIRNVRSPERTYPSEFRLRARVFERGRVAAEGRADFLAQPHLGLQGDVVLEDIDLEYFAPVLARYHVVVRDGTLAARGRVEYAPTVRIVHLTSVAVRDLDADYEYTARPAAPEKQVARKTAEVAEEVANDPETLLRADQIAVTGAVGFRNRAADPDYRVTLTGIDLDVRNFSNHFSEGPATARLRGRFMGSGATVVTATFRPETRGPDFDLAVAIEDTDLRRMNDLLRAYGKFDVTRGLFSFFAELTVKNRQVDGYVKPLFRDLQVYDRRQDAEKGAFRKLYEKLVGGLAKLLENRTPRQEVATAATIEGRVGKADADTWEVVVRLIQNAFFQAILPGFEAELAPGDRRRAGRS